MAHKKKTLEENAFKNWINHKVVQKIAAQMSSRDETFSKEEFEKVGLQLEGLPLKPRVQLIATQLHKCCTKSYVANLKTLTQILQKPKPNLSPLESFEIWPLAQYIETQGLSHPQESLEALYVLTQYFTSEFAVRPYLLEHQAMTLNQLRVWSQDSNEHVRRWCSEGSRPRLPWGQQLPEFIKNPELTLPILEKLKYDESLYVRKSVANHLNDISKDHPSFVVKTLQKWQKQSPMKHQKKIHWISQHALRTLIKKGDAGALKLMGFKTKISIQASLLKLSSKTVKIGDALEFSFHLESSRSEKLVIDYAIHFVKSNGQKKAKVFKLTKKDISAGEKLEIKKRHSFKPVTTRTLFTGKHTVEILINGQSLLQKDFLLVSPTV